jgi:nitronate monooxygenase
MPHHDDPPREYASPPCYQHEFDVGPEPLLGADEVARRLNELLEGERAGALGLNDMKADEGDPALATLLDAVSRDEARFCAMLGHHLTRLGYTPSRATGVFYEKLSARKTLVDKLQLLDRGQSAVVRLLDELLPSIQEQDLCEDLLEMRDTHVRNIERCAAQLPGRAD